MTDVTENIYIFQYFAITLTYKYIYIKIKLFVSFSLLLKTFKEMSSSFTPGKKLFLSIFSYIMYFIAKVCNAVIHLRVGYLTFLFIISYY